VLPAQALVTAGTFDQEIAIAYGLELPAEQVVFRLELETRGARLLTLLQHSDPP
jgi:hypothetical protein